MNHHNFSLRTESQKQGVADKENSCVKVKTKKLATLLFLYTYSCHRLIFQTLTSLEFLDKVSYSLFLAVQFTLSPLFCPFFAICDIVKQRDTDTCTSVGACSNRIKNYITSTFLIIATGFVQGTEL